MTNIDQFESTFKAAQRTPFVREAVKIERVLLVTDRDDEPARRYEAACQKFLAGVLPPDTPWDSVQDDAFSSVGSLLQRVGERDPDLICTHRNLRIPAREYPYSLGVYIDVLTQATTIPVLLLPHPEALDDDSSLITDTSTVMAVTDHLTGDHHLVSYAAYFTRPQGKLLLTHVEDARQYERYIDVIGKIPSIDTESARESILSQLLKEPQDYVESCRRVLEDEALNIEVTSTVMLGRQLADYKRLVDEHQVNLMVINTKDKDQLAMHGLAYPLTIELRHTPMLLL